LPNEGSGQVTLVREACVYCGLHDRSPGNQQPPGELDTALHQICMRLRTDLSGEAAQ
jgi:hypothetical protein